MEPGYLGPGVTTNLKQPVKPAVNPRGPRANGILRRFIRGVRGNFSYSMFISVSTVRLLKNAGEGSKSRLFILNNGSTSVSCQVCEPMSG